MRSILTISYPHPDDRSSRAVISMYGTAPFENLLNAGAGTNCKAGITALCLLVLCSLLVAPVSAGMTTTEVTVTKLASDGVTVLNQTTVDWQWMKENLPVIGDGETIYYMQGPIFEDAWNEAHPGETYDPWNPSEDVNLIYKDHGEFMGTDVADLLDLAGGAEPQDRVKFVASDGLPKEWPAEYIYSPNARQGPFCLAWYHGSDTGYVNQSFTDGMRLYFLGETTNADGMHVWGNWDMHESWAEDYWYYYSGIYPSASGVSVQNIKNITIYSSETPRTPIADFTAEPVAGEAPLTVQFTDASANAPTEWEWDFGDGATSAEQNPEHIYQDDGVYTMTLTVSNSWGSDTCTREDLITVGTAEEDGAIRLSGGWNFVSVPCALASGLDTAAVFSGVSMAGRPMYSYDAVAGWKTLRADDPLSPLMAYWVYSETPCTVLLTFDPDPVSTPPERTLAQGWNAVGFTGLSPTSARNAFLSIVDEWSCAIGFGAGEQRYEVSFINGAQGAHGDGRDLEPMQGYWVFMRSAGRLCAISG